MGIHPPTFDGIGEKNGKTANVINPKCWTMADQLISGLQSKGKAQFVLRRIGYSSVILT